jgi:hypothetical protein
MTALASKDFFFPTKTRKIVSKDPSREICDEKGG